MAFLDLSTAQKKMRYLRENGELSPVHFGFHTWNEYDKGRYFMGSRKTTLLLGGEPNHGKSQVTNELVMQLIEKHGFKVAIFTTESGDVEKVFSHFCGLYMGKPYSKVRPDGKKNFYAMTDDEASEAEYFMLQHLYVFKQDRKDSKYQTLENIYRELEKAEEFYNIKFDTLVIDPIYDVDDFEPKADEVLRVLNRINLEAEESNRYDIIVNHVSETAKTVDKKGNRKKLVALADEFYGGKNNNRKALMQILVHRPLTNSDPDAGEIVLENQTNIHILKIKPEGMAKWGVYPIFWDSDSRRYYEIYDIDGMPYKDFAKCTKFYGRQPRQKINVSNITANPEQAFNVSGTKDLTDDYDEFQF